MSGPNGNDYFNQRRTLVDLMAFAGVTGPAVQLLRVKHADLALTVDAMAEVVRRYVAPGKTSVEFIQEILEVRQQIEAAEAVAAALQWVYREQDLERRQQESRLRVVH